MSSLDLSVYSAFVGAGVKEEDAKRAAEALSDAIERQFERKSKELATKADLESAKTDIIRWMVVTMFGGLAALAVIQKML